MKNTMRLPALAVGAAITLVTGGCSIPTSPVDLVTFADVSPSSMDANGLELLQRHCQIHSEDLKPGSTTKAYVFANNVQPMGEHTVQKPIEVGQLCNKAFSGVVTLEEGKSMGTSLAATLTFATRQLEPVQQSANDDTDLDSVIEQVTAKGIVVSVLVHQNEDGKDPDTSMQEIQEAIDGLLVREGVVLNIIATSNDFYLKLDETINRHPNLQICPLTSMDECAAWAFDRADALYKEGLLNAGG